MNEVNPDFFEFIQNPEPRVPFVLLLDTSGPMNNHGRIQQLNAGLVNLIQDLMTDNLAKLRVEIAIVSFGGGVNILQDFVTAYQFVPPELQAYGNAPMGLAIDTGLNLLKWRKQKYKTHGVAYFRPWMILITRSEPTDAWQAGAQRLHEAVSQKKTLFLAVGLEDAIMPVLRQIFPSMSIKWQDLRLKEIFQWLSASKSPIASTSSAPTSSVPTFSDLVFDEKERAQSLYRLLDASFSKDELRELCFEMFVDFDSLPGDGKKAKARELVSYCQRHGGLMELTLRFREKRPHLAYRLEG